MEILVDIVKAPGGCLGRMLARGDRRRRAHRPLGLSDDHVFPLPLLSQADVPRRGRGRLRARSRLQLARLVNVAMCVLNFMYVGREDAAVSNMAPTAAQKRVQVVLMEGLRCFLRDAPGVSGKATISQYLREESGYDAGDFSVALALGERAGVPDAAAGVDLAGALRP